MIKFALPSLLPALLLTWACLFSGVWPLLALVSITALVALADRVPRAPAQATGTGKTLSLLLAGTHLLLLPLGIYSLANAAHLGLADKGLLFIALGLFFGQISNSNAHELIHAPTRWHHRLGAFLYVTLLHGQHVSAHLRVHHIHVATDRDPNSAPLGQGFWRYLARAWPGEFRAGWQADSARHKGRGLHPYTYYMTGGVLVLMLSFAIAGTGGVMIHIGLAAYAQMQLFLSDYVQHYGLRRAIGANGKPVPTTDAHSWNAPAWYSNAMMLNAPRHSDHHANPAKPYVDLALDSTRMPMLPRPLPIMAVLALIPPLWRRVMDRRVRQWQSFAQASGP